MAKRRDNIQAPKTPTAVEQPTPTTLGGRVNTFVEKRLLGNPQSRTERDEAWVRLLVRGVSAIALFTLIVIVASLVYEQLIIPSQSVATVNGENITVAQFRERVKFERTRVLGLAINREQATLEQAQQLAPFYGQEPQELVQQFLQQDQQYQAWVQELQLDDQLGKRVLDDLVNEKLVQQKARELNISVDEARLQQSIDTYFGYDPTQVALIGTPATETPTPTTTPTPFVSPTPTTVPTATATPTLTPTPLEATAEVTAESTSEATAEATLAATLTVVPSPTLSGAEVQATYSANVTSYRTNIAQQAEVGQGVIDDFFRHLALQDAIAQTLLIDGNKTTYVNARHILVATEEEALEIVAALQGGASFADLATASSTDTGSGANGGDLGWAPAANYVPEFATATLTLTIGEISQPIKTQFGYHIIQVRAREDRVVEQNELTQVKSQLFNRWLQDLRTANEANIQLSDNWVNFVPSGLQQ
jgi:parvulin-like peptidyl-prolyl isomerase